jgi:Skp family chaperone for outer membrane proteins
LRDGRHRLEAAKRAGATEIKARIRAFRPDGKAEEVGVMSVPIDFVKNNKGTLAGLAAVGGAAAAGEEDAAMAGAGIIGAGKGLKSFKPKPGKVYPKGTKTVLVPRARNSRQIEKIQQDIAEDLQGISKDSDWLKKVDKAFRETRDQFEPNEFTPGEMTLDDGTKVTGLSALQRKHHELLKEIDEMKADTSSKSKTAILNKIKAFASGQNGTADKELLEQAKKLGLEKELRQVAATRVVPGLKTAGSPLENEKGMFTGLKNAGIQRILPILEAVGNVPGNPFIANPNTPAGRIQKYLFENSAKNLLNFEGGRLGRFGNEAQDLTEKDK